MSDRFRATLGAAAALAVAVGCGMGDNGLAGSISEVFPLDVSTVHVLRNDQAGVQYQANHDRDIDLVPAHPGAGGSPRPLRAAR
jgi:hypothetical protein